MGALLPPRKSLVFLVAALAALLLSCDAVNGLIEPQWEVAGANGKEGQFHFLLNPYALHIGQPENVRVERIETRSIKKAGGAVDVQKRERKVRVVLARCESASICNAAPHAEDTREITITPRMMGSTTVYVTAVVDEKEELKDSVVVRAQ
jgi:hypothetical protein